MDTMMLGNSLTPKARAYVTIGILVILGLLAGMMLANTGVTMTQERLNAMLPQASSSLEPRDIMLHNLGMLLIGVSIFLIMGLISVYFTVFRQTGSSFILALLLVLIPLLLNAIASIRVMNNVLLSSGIDISPRYAATMGFAGAGFGNIIIIMHAFEIMAVSILLYLSME